MSQKNFLVKFGASHNACPRAGIISNNHCPRAGIISNNHRPRAGIISNNACPRGLGQWLLLIMPALFSNFLIMPAQLVRHSMKNARPLLIVKSEFQVDNVRNSLEYKKAIV